MVKQHPIPLWREPLVVPVYLAALSAVLFVLHLILSSRPVQRFIGKLRGYAPIDEDETEDIPEPPQHTGFFSDIKDTVKKHGAVAFSLKTLRLLSCLALLGITMAAFIILEESDELTLGRVFGNGWKHKHKKEGHKHRDARRRAAIHHREWIELAQFVFYTYTSLLAFLSLTLGPRLRSLATQHSSLLLFVAFGIYAYRDIWPLATFTLQPQDALDGWFTWSRVGILGFSAVLLPFVTPREYVPVDPSNPRIPAPEQTATPLSFIMFTFLDPIVFLAHKHPHLPYDQLPPLADYDQSSYLKSSSFPRLDPMRSGKKRHIFFGLLEQFRNDYLFMIGALVLHILTSFISPVAINRLLTYIEKGGEGALVRPWVWVISLFISPVASSIGMQLYIFVATRCLVRAEGILTQLIFEHSLRIRMKEDTPKTIQSAGTTTAGTTPRTQTADLPDVDTDAASGDESPTGSTTIAPSTTATSAKGPSSPEPEAKASSTSPESSNLVGKINNLMSTDLGNVTEARDFLFVLIYIPLEITLCVIFLYKILGWSAFLGMGFMVLTFPLPGKLAQLLNTVQVERMKRTDERVQAVSETMNVLRMIKLFGWESKVQEQMGVKRENELIWIRKRFLLNLGINNLNYILPLLTMIITFASYTILMGQALTAAKVFSSMTVFNSLQGILHTVFYAVPASIQGKVSIDRINEFLNTTELLDRYTGKEGNEDIALEFAAPGQDREAIGFHNAVFAWSQTLSSGAPTPGRRNFRLRVDGDLMFQKGKINLILGPTGSGKTSLLLALLGELHFSPPGPDSWYNLPRDKGVAYAAQEPWVQNETIRDNILFGKEYDAERYKKVLYQCGLDRDLTLFEAGDQTEVGEKGLTLSGGQKARVSLARAIYSSAEIILLDDVLAALDVHTARWVVDKCFTGDLIRGRTLILVTHNVAMTSQIADFVVSIGSDGRIASRGTISDALSHNKALLTEVAKEQEEAESEEKIIDGAERKLDTKPSGKLMTKEEIAEGHVSWAALKLYLNAMGGPWFWIIFVGGMGLTDFGAVVQTWFLGYWARQYDIHLPSEVRVPHLLLQYSLITMVGMTTYCVAYAVYIFGSVRASRRVHEKLIKSVMGTTLRFLDSTPIGRVIARFTQDMRAVDGSVTQTLQDTVELTITLIIKFFAVIYMSPIFLVPGVVVAAIGGWLGNVYIAAQLAVKREMSNARSPLFSHFGAAIGGLTSIRAYNAENMFIDEALKRIDNYTRPARTFYNLNRWICVRVDAIGGLFSASLAAYLVYGRSSITASDTGFQLNLAVSFTSMLLWWVRCLNEFEVQGNSLERIQDYVTIEQEPAPTESGKPPAYWPASGTLVIDKLSARYSEDGPEVLHELSFEIKSGEKVGVVGRTGSGKSSLTLSLLRMIPTSGHVFYDGVNTSKLNLDAVRGNITIIPQQPELLSGTIRQNLDPFLQHDDVVLNDALRSAGLFTLQKDISSEEQISLDSTVSSGGGNFSLGQRQILALARALVRRSKILILDEATASLDHETDTLVQQSLSTEFNDCTLITVAHRLHTIMNSDKILVLDAGRLVEFDSPSNLLQKKGGAFKGLVDESGDRDTLYQLAAGASGSK